MASKRKLEGMQPSFETENPIKKLKKGFSVGPANLPDGTHRRKGLAIPSYENSHLLIEMQFKK